MHMSTQKSKLEIINQQNIWIENKPNTDQKEVTCMVASLIMWLR